MKPGVELHLKTLPNDVQNEDVALGMEAVLRELESSESTAALTRYVIAMYISHFWHRAWSIGGTHDR
jgi:hypothetical protein